MQDIELTISISNVRDMHAEFWYWKRSTILMVGTIQKRYAQLWAFIQLCNVTLRVTPAHEKYKFFFSAIEAQALIVDIKYMVDTPATLQALQAKLQARLAQNQVTIQL